MTGQEPRPAKGPPEPEAPNAFDDYRRTHPGTWDRALGDLAPGTLMAVNPYKQTGRMIHDFLEVEPKKHPKDRPIEAAPVPKSRCDVATVRAVRDGAAGLRATDV